VKITFNEVMGKLGRLSSLVHIIEVLKFTVSKKSIHLSFSFSKPLDKSQKTNCIFKALKKDGWLELESLKCTDLQNGKTNYTLAPEEMSSLTFHDPKSGKVTTNTRTMGRLW
jgi:hypothetical protein